MKQFTWKRVLSLVLCLSLLWGLVPHTQAEPPTYQVDLARGINLVPQDLLKDETFMSQFVRKNGATLNLNHRFGLVGSSNVTVDGSKPKNGNTLNTGTMKRDKTDFWWVKYQWQPSELEKQYLNDSAYPLYYEGYVIPNYCTHWIADDHWCQACVRFTANDWNFGDQDRFGGNFIWYVSSNNSNSGTPQAVKKEMKTVSGNTLTYAAYSQKQQNCGDPRVSGSVFYMVDTTAPYITDVSLPGASYRKLDGENNETVGTVVLTFSEDIRFADNKVPAGLKLNLEAFYGSQAGDSYNAGTQYPLSADFTSLSGNQMVFTYKVPNDVKNIYIKGLVDGNQPMMAQSTLLLFDGNGKQIEGTKLTTASVITDITGNALTWGSSDKSCYTVTYDGVAPTLNKIEMSGRDINAGSTKEPASWEDNSGNNANIYAGVGDTITFTATYSEGVNIPRTGKAVLSVKDPSGEFVKLDIKSTSGSEVVFKPLTVTQEMADAGTRITITGFENMDVTDYAGNDLSGAAVKTPSQNIMLDVDKPEISTTLTAENGVYKPYADTEGEYFTFPMVFSEAKPGNIQKVSGINGKKVEFTLEMLNGGQYSYRWYVDGNQQVNKQSADLWNTATTGTKKVTLMNDVADGLVYYLHIRLDQTVDYGYTAEGGMDEGGIYFNGSLTAYVQDWAGNTGSAVFVLQHQVDTEGPGGKMLGGLTVTPSYAEGNVTFTGSFTVTDNYSIEKVTYQWFRQLGNEAQFTPLEVVELTNLGTGLNTSVSHSTDLTYDYTTAGAPVNGMVYLRVVVEDRLGKSYAFESNIARFNYAKATSNSDVQTNSADDPMVLPQVDLAAPNAPENATLANNPRTMVFFADTRNEGAYWVFDPWDGTNVNYGTQPFVNLVRYLDKGFMYQSQDVWYNVPGRFYYVQGTFDPAQNSGTFTNVLSLKGTNVDGQGTAIDLYNYLNSYYGPMELYMVTTSSLAWPGKNEAVSMDFSAMESHVDGYTVYLAHSIDYEVQNIVLENAQVLNYTSGAPAANLDNATVRFQIVNTTNTEQFQYGLNFVDYDNAVVELWYMGARSDNYYVDLVETWELMPTSDGSYTIVVEPGVCEKNGWYRMEVRLSNLYTDEEEIIRLGQLFMDSTVLTPSLDRYYKNYDHEGLVISNLGEAWNRTELEDSYLAGEEIVLGLDTAPEGWTLNTYLSFSINGRSRENDELYWNSFDVNPRLRVYNHTYNAAAGLENAASGIWLESDGREGSSFNYLPYLAQTDAQSPYGTAEDLKLPFVEGYNLLVYEAQSINGTITKKEITVNAFGQADQWELDTQIVSKNGMDVNSVTASAVYPSSNNELRFGYLDSTYSYYESSYVFTDDLDVTFYLIDDQGNLSVKDYALRDENGELVDVDGSGPYYVGFSDGDFNEYGSTYSTFHFIVYAYDYDSAMDARDLTLTFDEDYSALLMGLTGEERDENTQRVTMPIPLALDENGQLLKNEDGTYAVWESYDTSHYGIYRTQVLYEGERREDDFSVDGFVEIEIWGTWKHDPEYDYSSASKKILTVTAVDAFGNTTSNDRTYSAAYVSYDLQPNTLDENGEVNGDYGDLNEKGELGLASEVPFASIVGYGAGKQIETVYSYYGYRQFYTTAPMISRDGTYTFRVTDLFGDEYDLEVYVYAFGELGIDVSYSVTEPTNQSVTVMATAIGEYDAITSITADNGTVGTVDSGDPRNASITVEENCAITIETEDGMSRVVQVSNIDKELDPVRIVYYDESYNLLDAAVGATRVTAQIVCDTEVIYVTNGPASYDFPLGSKAGDTYTFEYQDRAGNTGTITATLPCDLADVPDMDDEMPNILVSMYAVVVGRSSSLGSVANPDDGAELNGYLAGARAKEFRLVFTIDDAGATKVLIQPAGAAAPAGYASAVAGSTVEDVALSVSGRTATVTVSANTEFDVHIIDEAGNVRSVPGIIIDGIDDAAPVLTPVYEVAKNENGDTIIIVTFEPDENHKLETIKPLSADIKIKKVQIGEEEVDGEMVPIMAERYYYVFTANGIYTFTYQDELGNIGISIAQVKNLNNRAAVVSQVNWFGTKTSYGLSNVVPSESAMVSRDVVAQLRMDSAISDVKLYAYDPAAENGMGEALDQSAPVSATFTAKVIDVTYTANVDQQILVEFTAFSSGRKGYYVLEAVTCIDKEAPTVRVTGVKLADDHRSAVITFMTGEEAVMTPAADPRYGTVHTWTATDNAPAQITFVDRAGNRTVYQLTENADVDVLELDVLFSLNADGTDAVQDPVKDLQPDVGDTIYYRVNKKAAAELAGISIGTAEANTWTALQLPEAGGVHILKLTDASTGEVRYTLLAAWPKDNVAPVIELESGTVLVTEDASVAEMLAAVNAGVRVTDNADETPALTVAGYPETVEMGLYTLTYTAEDAAGNSSTATRNLFIMAEGTPLLKINGEIGLPYGKVFLEKGAESTDITLELLNMEEMTDQPLVVKYHQGMHTTGQMKYNAVTVEDMQFSVTETGHYTIYVRSQDRVEFVVYIYVEG